MIKKIILFIINWSLHLLALSVLAWCFWPFFDLALRATMLVGFDSAQFLYYVNLFSHQLPLPPAGWDNLWFEGAPRVLDYVFLPHYLIQPLVVKFGLILATKIYPLFWLCFFFLTSYFLFYRLSKNQLFATLITLGVMFSKTIYQPVYLNGVVVSGLSNYIFPSIMLFLVIFAQTKSFRYLALAALALAFQIYNHPAMALTFGLVSASVFLFFLKFPDEKFLSFSRIKRFFGFMIMTVSVASLTIFPQLIEGLSGAGNYGKSPFGQPNPIPLILEKLIEFTHPAVLISLGLAAVVGLIFYKKQAWGMLLAFLSLLVYFLVFVYLEKIGINPVGDFLFPTRVFWYFAVIMGCLSALLLAPLTSYYQTRLRFLLPFTWIIIGAVIVGVLIKNPFDLSDYQKVAGPTILSPEAGDKHFFDFLKRELILSLGVVDLDDINVRIWDHSGSKIIWNMMSKVPQVEGYFHYMTKYSGEWTAWFNATLAEEVVKNKTIPQDMADKQAQFLIDWFGVKYLLAAPGEEFNLAPRFYQDNDYVLTKSADTPPAMFTIKPEKTSGLVEAVNVPVVGFIGSETGYNLFLRDLGMLNLNTHYLIPLRLGTSINNVSKEDLNNLDLLVLYGLKDKGGDWGNIADFVKNGGKLFLETGGDSVFIGVENLPEVFPMNKLAFGSLGSQWQVEKNGGISNVDFTRLEPLIYQGTPWKLSYVDKPIDLRGGSAVLLAQAGKPVIVKRDLGKGKIIWAGLNSLYRPWELKDNGMQEIEIVGNIIKELIETPYAKPLEIKIQREKPEEITVWGSGFSGVILKEKNLPGWQGIVKGGDQVKKLKVYAAGPDFMYFAIPSELRNSQVTVSLVYEGYWFYWLLFFVSIIAAILVIEEIITNGALSQRLVRSRFGRMVKTDNLSFKINSWWEKGEE